LAASPDEEVARNFLLFARPDVTVVVVDATRLERNLNLVLQILEITPRVVLCLNLMDQARRNGLQVDDRRLARDLGIPVVATSARYREGMDTLLLTIHEVASGKVTCRGHRLAKEPPALRQAVQFLVAQLETVFPGLPNVRWVALRLLEGDDRVIEAVRTGELSSLAAATGVQATAEPAVAAVEPARRRM
jgi:ferrous iron transport protein B